ncbi:MAG: methylmalonyl-CoA epimerase [Actinomycetota bacterium]
MNLTDLDHVGIACTDLEAEIARYRNLFGVEVAHREVVADQGVEEALLPVGDSFVQLLRPLGPDTPVGRFLAERGPGLHHLAFRVDDVGAALARLRAEGAQLVDETPRAGSRGTRIAFVHPKAMGGVLIELVEP